tara:strand:+ start:12516 stop:14345 length:1830 start_codon:yes stop_codon:yes gene_type:complete
MCGIVGACAQRNVADILIEGLKRLEYRGYDSAGVATLDQGVLKRERRIGKVKALEDALSASELLGHTGIAHTRWATHGAPSEENAHPHVSQDRFAVVHNGIIENHATLRQELCALGYHFESDTDTEVIVHLVDHKMKTEASLLHAVQAVVSLLHGAYGMVVIDQASPDEMVVARSGSPLVIGYGVGEHFVASDQLALLPVTHKFSFLEEGDVAHITAKKVIIYDAGGQQVERSVVDSDATYESSDKGAYRHYMLKETYEQPEAIKRTLADRIDHDQLKEDIFGANSKDLLKDIEHIQIIACGTSYHAGLTARYWLEQYAGVSCQVEIASEFRYRKSYLHPKSLLVTLSQSGETADTLAALRLAKELGYSSTLTICNAPSSSMVRESDMVYLMKAGPEVGVASTKAFTVQLTALLLLTGAIAQYKNQGQTLIPQLIQSLQELPQKLEQTLTLATDIERLAEDFAEKHHALFLGRGEHYPIAMEGALKLKEISYIHAEAYAAGELKHGPLALIDNDMPVIVVAPNNKLLEKLHANVEEVRARGGLMYVFADAQAQFESDDTMKVIPVPHCDAFIEPIIYTVPLQLLSYYVALIKGTDVDQPRNLAKSVTVE